MRYCCINLNSFICLDFKGISIKALKKGKEENMSVCRNKLTWRSLKNLNFNKFLRAAQMCLQWQGFSIHQLSGESHCLKWLLPEVWWKKVNQCWDKLLNWKNFIVFDVFIGNFSQEEIAVLSYRKNYYLYSLNERGKNKQEEWWRKRYFIAL